MVSDCIIKMIYIDGKWKKTLKNDCKRLRGYIFTICIHLNKREM